MSMPVVCVCVFSVVTFLDEYNLALDVLRRGKVALVLLQMPIQNYSESGL